MNKASDAGFVMISTMIVMLAASIIVVAFLLMTFTVTKNASYNEQDNQAFWIAEAGVQYAGWQAEYQNPGSFSTMTVLMNGQYSVSATKQGRTYTIVSTGTVTSTAYTSTRVVTQAWNQNGPVSDTWSEL